MAVRMRLKRLGRKNRPFYRICVFDHRTRRDGRAIEELGHYDPLLDDEDKRYQLDRERILFWLNRGATPTETVLSILLRQGVDVPGSEKKRALSPEERAERDRIKEEKRRKREEAIQRKKVQQAVQKPMTKKEKREAKKAGGL